MFDSFVAFLERFTFNLTGKSFVSFLLLLFLAGVFVYGYERFTDSFQLSRLERTTALLKELGSLRPNLEKDSTLIPIYRAIQRDVSRILEEPSTPLSLNPVLLKALAAAAPWLLITLVFLASAFKGTSPLATVFGGLMFVVIFGLTGMLLPDSLGSNFNYVIYPVGHFIVVATILVIWQRRKRKSGLTSGSS